MPLEVLKCPHCGTTLLTRDRAALLNCTHCGQSLKVASSAGSAGSVPSGEASKAAPGTASTAGSIPLFLGNRSFLLQGRLAQGESTDVFWGHTDATPTEWVVVKLLRVLGDADLLTREWRAIKTLLQSTTQGSPYFSQLLPQPVTIGETKGSDALVRPASVFRWRSGFLHTLDDVVRAHENKLDPSHAMWMWRRSLELLGWVHRSGYLHGSLLPQHLLIHPRDHGVVFVGWSCAVRWGLSERLPARCDAARAFYPDEVWHTAKPSVGSDLSMLARCVIHLLGGDVAQGEPPKSLPDPLATLLRSQAQRLPAKPVEDDAWKVMEQVKQARQEALGSTRYQPLDMPGWR
jgi:hypothetical protein